MLLENNRGFSRSTTEDTPEISLNHKTGEFEFEGCSMPENVTLFYEPVLDWLGEYIKSPNKTTQFSFKLRVISSSSTKIFYDIIRFIKKLAEMPGVCVKVLWYYNIYDDEIREQGMEYKNELDLPFELILYGE